MGEVERLKLISAKDEWSPLKTPFKKDEKYVKKQNERKRII